MQSDFRKWWVIVVAARLQSNLVTGPITLLLGKKGGWVRSKGNGVFSGVALALQETERQDTIDLVAQ